IRLHPSETSSEAFWPAGPPAGGVGGGAASTLVRPEPLLRVVRLVTGLKAFTAGTWVVWGSGGVKWASNGGIRLASAVKLTVQLRPGRSPIGPGGVNRKRPGAASTIVQVPAGQSPAPLLPVVLRLKTPASAVAQSLAMITDSGHDGYR